MARRNRRPVATQRVTIADASPLLGAFDNRLWSPEPAVPRTAVLEPTRRRGRGVLVAPVAAARPRLATRPHDHGVRLHYVRPNKIAVCIRRKQRRQVLFATRNTGKGAKSPRRRNYYSQIGC